MGSVSMITPSASFVILHPSSLKMAKHGLNHPTVRDSFQFCFSFPVTMVAASIGNTAFLAPVNSYSPVSFLPPLIRNCSTRITPPQNTLFRIIFSKRMPEKSNIIVRYTDQTLLHNMKFRERCYSIQANRLCWLILLYSQMVIYHIHRVHPANFCAGGRHPVQHFLVVL